MKALKIILKTLLILCVLGGLGYGGWYLYNTRMVKQAEAATVSYTGYRVGTGSLTRSVTGTGSLSISTTEDVTVPFPVTIAKALVREGESVTEGQAIAAVDTDALKSTIIAMNEEILELDSSIATLTNTYKETSTVQASAAGRIKAIYCKVGDMTSTVITEYGGLMLLSTDGKMKVTLKTSKLSLDQAVTVRSDGKDYKGTVGSVEDKTAVVTFPDTVVLPGASCDVFLDGEKIGSARAEVNMPAIVNTSTDGYIFRVYVKLNAKVARKANLLYLTHIPADTQYDEYCQQRDAKVAALAQARAVLISGEITSPVSGIVSTVSARGAYEAKDLLAEVFVGNAKQMVISVDELDIIHVALGQEVSIAMDAVTDRTYSGKVSYISQIGSSSSGVTNYSVTLDVDGDELLKIGMNGTATIVVDKVDDAVLVPLTALSYGRGGSYVWLYDAEAEESRRQVYVETGLSSADYAEVRSGLSAGDVVLVTRTAAGGSAGSAGVDLSQLAGAPSNPGGMQMPSGQGGNWNGGQGSQRNNGTQRNGSGR